MREQRCKKWSLFLFRKYESKYFENIETSIFKFGRTKKEILENEGDPMSEGLISIVRSKNLQDIVMETGLVIDFTTVNPKNNDYILLTKLISTLGTLREYGYSLYSFGEEKYPLRFVDLGKPCDNTIMPQKIWITLRALSINEISWGIENELLGYVANEKLKGEQCYLNDFGFNIQKEKRDKKMGVAYCPDLPFPGPSDLNHKFLN